MGLRMRKE
jgi:hypothetical protein